VKGTLRIVLLAALSQLRRWVRACQYRGHARPSGGSTLTLPRRLHLDCSMALVLARERRDSPRNFEEIRRQDPPSLRPWLGGESCLGEERVRGVGMNLVRGTPRRGNRPSFRCF
jgi:hypothetical protein